MKKRGGDGNSGIDSGGGVGGEHSVIEDVGIMSIHGIVEEVRHSVGSGDGDDGGIDDIDDIVVDIGGMDIIGNRRAPPVDIDNGGGEFGSGSGVIDADVHADVAPEIGGVFTVDSDKLRGIGSDVDGIGVGTGVPDTFSGSGIWRWIGIHVSGNKFGERARTNGGIVGAEVDARSAINDDNGGLDGIGVFGFIGSFYVRC